MTDSKLKRIGEDLASMYGGYCNKITKTRLGYKFYCVEHGEKFVTEMSRDEAEDYFNLDVKA